VKEVLRETAVLVGAAICSSALITYDGSWWRQGLRVYVPWALVPYALLLFGSLTARSLGLYGLAQPVLRWAVIIVALAGPLLYIDTLFVHRDAQGGLTLLMIAPTQTVASAILIIALHLSGWRARRIAATAPRHGAGTSGAGRAVKLTLAGVAGCAALFYSLTSVLQFLDRQAIDTAKEVDFYITQYCEKNMRLPTSARLHERFPGLSPDTGWFYFSDNETWLKLQYPVRWRNRNAIGTPKTSEFTATTYSYSIEYHCGAPRM
jgi:hypothetical protein